MPRTLSIPLLLLAGCGTVPGPPPPPVTDLAGTYAVQIAAGGTIADGQLRITGAPDDWAGSIYSDLTGEVPIRAVRVAGQQVTLSADTPTGTADFRLVFDGDSFTGDWSIGVEGGAIRGRRVSTDRRLQRPER